MLAKTANGSLPVIQMISQRETTIEISNMFQALNTFHKLNVKTIMTDDAKVYNQTISEYFPNARHLLCQWHLFRAWKSQIAKCYSYKESKAVFAKMIRVQKELDANKFEEKFSALLKELNRNFSKYLIDHYQN